MKGLDARGFTLAELMVVLAILALGSALTVAGLNGYQKHALAVQNRAGAQRVYQTAEAGLAELKATGQLASWLRLVEQDTADEAETVTLFLDRQQRTGAVWQLLQNALTEEELDAAICLQLDTDAGHLVAVYYDATADTLRREDLNNAEVGCWMGDAPAKPAAAPPPEEALLWRQATPEEAG